MQPDIVPFAIDGDSAARCVLAVRQMMTEALSAEFVLNPAIDMLIALYLERDAAGPMSQADLCSHTNVTADVCRRWGAALAKRELISVDDDGYRLTAQGVGTMRKLNTQIWQLASRYLGAHQPD